jgi:heparin/heparan-sulfate lyase
MKKFHRHFLWLNKIAGWSRPVILVFDDVIATRDSFRKAYLLHMQEEPQIAGRRVLVRHGDGTLYQWTVLPKKADLTLIGGKGKEFWVNGQNFPPERGPKDSEEPGAWRIEVSPVAEDAAQRFLHALYVADGDAAPPVEPVSLAAGQFEGCVIGEYSILFNAGEPLDTLEYPSGRGATSHLIFGAVPLAKYDLYIGDVLFRSVEASFSGTISFKVPIPAIIRIVRVP